MTYTYQPTTDVGKCRLLVKDVNSDEDEDLAIFQDEDYQAFLAIEGDVRLAAAAALETIASNQALILSVVKAGSASIDGAAVSDAILKRAAMLRAQGLLIDPTTGAVFAGFDIAEQVFDPHSFGERVVNQRLRGN